jgi:hypothetical protein
MSLLSLLDKICTVQVSSPNPDQTGAPDPTWSNVVTNVPCSLSTDREIERHDFQRDDSLLYFKLTTAQNINATTANRIIIAGVVYAVRVATTYASNTNIDPTVVYSTKLTLRR